MTEKYCVILTTTSSQDEAERISETLVARKLAACVQYSNITSTYRWKEEIHKDAECLLLIKTRAGLYEKVETTILENHSYELPEIIQIPITQGLDRYLEWVEENTLETSK